MSSLQKYNQIIIAVAGTAAALVIIVSAGVMAASWLLSTVSSNRHALAAEDRAQKVAAKDQRLQEIRFGSAEVLDSNAGTFLIPVMQTTLRNRKKADTFNEILPRNSYSKSCSFLYGPFNNLIIYNSIENSLTPIFKKRISISHTDTRKILGKTVIFMPAQTDDTNKDGLIDSDDLSTLYWYCVEDEKLITVSEKLGDIQSFTVLPDENRMLVEFGIDENKDGRYDAEQERNDYRMVCLVAGTVSNFIPDELKANLQSIIDAKKDVK
jgi:hypothetical protein